MAYEDENPQTITGDTLDEIKKKLFSMYGRDYRIIDRNTDFIHTGILNLRRKPIQRVTFVVNHQKAYDSPYVSRADEVNQMEDNRKKFLLNPQIKDILENARKNESQSTNDVKNSIEQLKKELTEQIKNISVGTTEKHATIEKIEELLQQNEFTFKYIQMIEDKIRAQFNLDQLDDFKLVQRYVVDWIGESIEITPEKIFRPPHVVIVVGPTGVGKTTTIAKLASNSILEAKAQGKPKPELCIITIDTMRVGSLEQLSKFGDILGKQVLKAESQEDLQEIFDNYKDHVDYIFVDTSGYSPNDAMHIGDMKNRLSVDNMNADVYLSLCASTKSSDLNNIIRNFEPFGFDSVIVTKCDETNQMGNIISVLWDKHKSISYITDGQRVPKNIRRANVIDILKTLSGFEIDRIHLEDKFGEK